MKLLLVVGRSASTPAISEAAGALGYQVAVADSPEDARVVARVAVAGRAVVDLDATAVVDKIPELLPVLAAAELKPLAIATDPTLADVRRWFDAGVRDVISAPLHKRELILRLAATLQGKLRIACIGGGSGLYTLLSGIKEIPRTLLSSIVSMSDDGGSSGRLRTSFGVLPPGDVRRSLVALSNAPELMNHVMQYRFERGDELSGHSVGNLILTALSELTGNMPRAVRALGDILNVAGIVLGVTEASTTLCAEFEDGRIVRGESQIDRCVGRPPELRIQRLWHEPEAHCGADVYASLLAADLITIGPGDLYTSVVAGLTVGGVAEAVRHSRAKKLYLCNLMTKPGETSGYDVADHVSAVVAALGGDALDWVLLSSTEPDREAQATYAAQGQHPVTIGADPRLQSITRAKLLRRDLGDRSHLVRHDPEKLRREVEQLLQS
jgi:uncharacterized cofD-like protein